MDVAPAGGAQPVNQTGQAVLDATLQVIGERGVRGATTRAIAQAAGVNEVTVFRHFGNKTNLIQSAVNNRFAAVERQAVHYTGDIEADLASLAQGIHAALAALGPVARSVFAELPLDPQLADGIAGPRELFGAVSAMLGRYQREGLLADEPAGSLIPAFIGPILIRVLLFTDNPVAPPGLTAQPFDVRGHVKRFLYGRLATPQADQRPTEVGP
ncbi:MAG: TetR/AcrR family transcriptional regulator [Propionibacteriaceae bacterium]|jgi:AcrR family transcriptional regulator|nr:TetR/AcrR family transcriptional regulator [Propionibacteriaceae bacterium]